MNNDDCYLKLNWSPIFEEIKNLGMQLIDLNRLLAAQAAHGDGHAIVSRIFTLPDNIVESLPFHPHFMQVFGCTPNTVAMTHKDGKNRGCALNIPLMGTDQGIMQWFQESSDLVEMYVEPPNTKIRITEFEYLNREKRVSVNPDIQTTVNQPTLVNTNTWHRINNLGNANYRWMASIRFEVNPTFQEAQKALISSGGN